MPARPINSGATSPKMKVKKGDKVVVITGRDKGKTGEIVKVIPKDQRVIVAGINQVKKHKKPSATNAGGIDMIDLPIHVSNIAFFDVKTSKPTRLGSQTLKDGTKVRVAKRSGEVLGK